MKFTKEKNSITLPFSENEGGAIVFIIFCICVAAC